MTPTERLTEAIEAFETEQLRLAALLATTPVPLLDPYLLADAAAVTTHATGRLLDHLTRKELR